MALLLSARLFAVLKGVPAEWWSEDDAKSQIALATGQDVKTVARRLGYLRRVQLVERRGGCALGVKFEILRVPA